MKNFVLKLLNVILTIIMVLSCVYAVFNLVMTFLPAEIQSQVYDALNMSGEYIATFSISSAVNAVVIVGSKIAQTQTRIKLTAKLTQAEQLNQQNITLNETVAERENEIINNQKVIQILLNALLSVQKVTTKRNINASDKLVYEEEKEAYKEALAIIEQAQAELEEVGNIATVYEKTKVTEVVVEKEKITDEMSGRV